MPWAYDITADFYDEDMGRNTDMRDAAWYVAQTKSARGPVLELGCGTGRITLELAAAGIDVVAADRSPPMLERLVDKAIAAGLKDRIHPVALDMSHLCLARQFSAILCPYSAFGYLTGVEDRDRMLCDVYRSLIPGGTLLLDMYIPQPAFDELADGRELEDYRRELTSDSWHPAVRLIRSKRITRTGHGVNRIQRHYRFLDAAGTVTRDVETESFQRPYTPEEMLAILKGAGFQELTSCGDFDVARPAALPARMAAFSARSRAA